MGSGRSGWSLRPSSQSGCPQKTSEHLMPKPTRQCYYCDGTGKLLFGFGDCLDCHGDKVLCAMCGKRTADCDCPDEPRFCEWCGKVIVACRCDRN